MLRIVSVNSRYPPAWAGFIRTPMQSWVKLGGGANKRARNSKVDIGEGSRVMISVANERVKILRTDIGVRSTKSS